LRLISPAGFSLNRGLSSVAPIESADDGSHVAALTLDDTFSNGMSIGVLKIDVEGHELNVLQGAKQMLGARLVRDCVFESHEPYPSPVTNILEGYGYTVFRLVKEFRGPILTDSMDEIHRSKWEPPNLVATSDPDRLRSRFATRGWSCLRG